MTQKEITNLILKLLEWDFNYEDIMELIFFISTHNPTESETREILNAKRNKS